MSEFKELDNDLTRGYDTLSALLSLFFFAYQKVLHIWTKLLYLWYY